MKPTEEAARKVFGQRASKYTTSACHTDPRILAEVVRLASPEPDWSVLDVGTGTGHTAFALAPYVSSVTGIDLTPEMLREAEKLKEKHQIINVEFTIADVHQLPFEDGVFHLLTCRRAAHHFANISKALKEMKRVLRHRGRLVIDDRSVPEDDFLDDLMNELDRYHDESHVRQYRASEWRQMLETLGLAVEEVKPYIKHRPLTSLTEGVSYDNVQRIHKALDELNVSRRQALNLCKASGELYLNHWYVTVSARCN